MGPTREATLTTVYTGLGLNDPAQLAKEVAEDPTVEVLTALNPLVGFGMALFEGITKSNAASNPLYRFNLIEETGPATSAEAVTSMIKRLQVAQDLIDQEQWDDASTVLDSVRKNFYADLPKEQRDRFAIESDRFTILHAEGRRMQALVFEKQGKTKQAQEILQTGLLFFRQEFLDHIDENSQDRAEAFLVRGKIHAMLGNVDEAKADFEAAAKIDPDMQAQVDAYQKALEADAEEGEKRMIEEAKKAAVDGFLPAEKITGALSAYVTNGSDGLKFTEAYDKLEKGEKVVVFQSLFKIARLEKMRKGLETETDPVKKLFLESQVALTDGNLPLAQLKMVEFKNAAKDSKDEDILMLRNQVRLELRALALGSITRLEQRNDELIEQRRDNPEMLVSDAESQYRNHKNYLANLKAIVTDGHADTLEGAQDYYAHLAHKQYKAFENDHVLGSTVSTSCLPFWKQPRMGSDEFWAMKKSDREVASAYNQLELDPKLFEADAFPDTAYIRLEGGTYRTPPPSMLDPYPGIIRVVVGKEGGEIFTMDRKRVSFPASDEEKVVLLRGGNLEAAYPYLKENTDYFVHNTQFFEFSMGADDDFDALVTLETSEGWAKMKTSGDRRDHLLEEAEAVRSRNGSYSVAGDLLEEILAKDIEAAFQTIPEDKKKEITDEVKGEREKTEKQVKEQLDHLKARDPKTWEARYPDGGPTEDDIKVMVDTAQDAKIIAKLKREAFEKIDADYDSGALTDPTSRKAWDIYKDMKDPLDEFWNVSDSTGDRIVDEVVITVVTLPLTMGVGKVAQVGLEGSVLLTRLASMGRLGYLASRAIVFTGVAAAESLTQQAANPVTVLQILHDTNNPDAPQLFSMEDQLKDFGWGMLTSFAFHGGGSAWKKASVALKIEKNVLLNLGGMLSTQTLMGSGFGELELWLHDADAPGTVFERMGGHAARVLGRHYGTETFHLATGGQFRQTQPKVVKVVNEGVGPIPDLSLARQAPAKKTATKDAEPTNDPSPPIKQGPVDPRAVVTEPVTPVLAKQNPVDPKAAVTEPGAPKGDATVEVAVNGKSAAKDLSPEAKAEQDRLERIFNEAIEATKNGQLLGPEQQKAMAKLTSLQLINAKNTGAALADPFHVSAMEKLADAGGELGRMAREFIDLAKSARKKIGEYEKKVDAYHRSGEAKDLLEAENYFDKELDGDLAKLRSSDYYQLNKVFDESVARAEASLEPLTFELANREIQAPKEKPIKYRVRVKSLDELNLDANDPAGSLAKLEPKDLLTVEVRTTDEAQKTEIEKAIKDKGWENLPVTVTSAEAPAKTQTSATSSFAVAGPAMGAPGIFEQLTSWGIPPVAAGLLTGIAVLGSTVAMGMAFNGRFNRAPEPLEMRQGGLPKTLGPSHDVIVKYRADAPGGGGFVLINGPENNSRKSATPIFVNGEDVSGQKFKVLGPKAEITIGDRTYSFKDMTPPSAKPSEYVTERPYFGERATGIFRVSGPNTAKNDAAFRVVQTGEGGTVTFLVQGKGKTAAQLGAVSEVDTAIANSVEAGVKVEDIVNGARPQAQMFVAIPTLMPKIDVMVVELKPTADDATEFDARFIASGPDTSKMNDTGLEAWVFRPSNTNEASFKASGYISSPDKPLRTGDVILTGRLSEMFSEKFIGDVVGRLSKGGRVFTNVELQGALIQEARVRSKMLENAGGKDVVLTKDAYNKAFTDLYGTAGTPLTYKGLYSGDANALSGNIEYYTLKANGDVVDYRGKTVDHFKAESEGIGFMAQVVGSK